MYTAAKCHNKEKYRKSSIKPLEDYEREGDYLRGGKD